MKKLQIDLGKKYNSWAFILAAMLLILSFWTIDTVVYSNYRSKQKEAYWNIDDVCSAKGTPTAADNGKTIYVWSFDEKACREAIEAGKAADVKTQSCLYSDYKMGKVYGLSPIKKAYRSDKYVHYIATVGEDDRSNCVDDIELGIAGEKLTVFVENGNY